MTFRTLFALLVILGLFGAACGDSTTTTYEPDQLEGQEFWSTSVLDEGADRPLVTGTNIVLRFVEGNLDFNAGCNSGGGPYQIVDGTLVANEFGITEMGCDPDRHAQDQFVIDFLSAHPSISLVGDKLTMATATTTITLLNRRIADPDRDLIGTRWEVTGFQNPQASMSFAIDNPGWFTFADDATMTGFDGCHEFVISASLGINSLEFQMSNNNSSSGPDNCNNVDYSTEFNRLFDTAEVSISITGPNLTLLNAQGVGLTAVAS